MHLSEKIGDTEKQAQSLQIIGSTLGMKEGKIEEAISYFLSDIEKCEQMRGSLPRQRSSLRFPSADRNIHSYSDLSMLLCVNGNPIKALYVSELSRARALADLMSAQYSVENQIFIVILAHGLSLESVVAKECNRTCLYVSYNPRWRIYLWTLKAGRDAHILRRR